MRDGQLKINTLEGTGTALVPRLVGQFPRVVTQPEVPGPRVPLVAVLSDTG